MGQMSLDELWDAIQADVHPFRPADAAGLPEAAQRFLEHAITPGTPLARAVRLRMHGEIKLQRWLPFRAEEVIIWDCGFIWSATVRMLGLPIRGSDRLVDGEGGMRWRLLNVIPVMTASGPDITRSAAGRLAAEAVWLPSVLCGEDVSWTAPDPSHPRASFSVQGEPTELELAVNESGRLRSVKLQRWGDPDGTGFRYAAFGSVVEEEGSFGGYTIPTRVRVGWHLSTDRFESAGEFFRGTIDDATYR